MIAVAVVWPVLHVLVFAVRFGEMPVRDALADLPLFLPTGLVAALLVRLLLQRAQPGAPQRAVVLGIIGALPFAFAGNLVGGLLGPIGVTVFGVVPLLVGAGVGWAMSRLWTDVEGT